MSINQIIYLNTLLNNEQVDTICTICTGLDEKNIIINNIENLTNKIQGQIPGDLTEQVDQVVSKNKSKNVKEFITNLINTTSSIKYTELCDYIDSNENNSIKLNFVEDWKEQSKLNLIKLLIVFEYFDQKYLTKVIGDQSKKTYSNGEIINDNSLSLKKLMDKEIKEQIDIYYKEFDTFRDSFINLSGKTNNDFILKGILEINKIAQCELVCRKKYESNNLDTYRTKICDIVETRDKEANLYELFNKIRWRKLVRYSENSALKFILYNTWSDTKFQYRWLTELVTFINNNSNDSKDYLITRFKIPNFNQTDYKTKCKFIKDVSNVIGLKSVYQDDIVKFIFSIGTFFKHGTYYKWYAKELEHMDIFDTYKNKSFNVVLDEFKNNIVCDETNTNNFELINKLDEFNIFMINFVNNMQVYVEL